MRSTAVAAQDIAALGSRRAGTCFARDGSGGTGPVSVRSLRAPIGAGPAVRVAGRDRVEGRPFRYVMDQFAFHTGPAEVIVVVATVNPCPT